MKKLLLFALVAMFAVSAMADVGWSKPAAIEPFVTCIDGTVTAAIGAATIRTAWSMR